MSTKASIATIAQFVDQEVTLNGWLYNIRGSGKIAFPQLRDGTGIIQAVAKKAVLGDESFDELRHLGQESSLSLTGTIHADERAQGGYEMSRTTFPDLTASTFKPSKWCDSLRFI